MNKHTCNRVEKAEDYYYYILYLELSSESEIDEGTYVVGWVNTITEGFNL